MHTISEHRNLNTEGLAGSEQAERLVASRCVSYVLQWADVLALSGDAADNVPGVKGVGIKTAPVLVRAHGDVEGVLATASQEKKKVTPCFECQHATILQCLS